MVAYLSLLVKVIKRFPCVELHFLILGHTKFSPDKNFGHIKSRVRSKNCYRILDLIGDDSLLRIQGGKNHVITYKEPNSLIKQFQWNDGKKFFSNKFLPCNGIPNLHKIKILPDNYAGFPDIIEPNGLSEDRMRDLEFF